MLMSVAGGSGQLCDGPEGANPWTSDAKEIRYGRGPYVSNGMPIASGLQSACCGSDPCYCRSDVIFYDGVAYDQKPFIAGRLRTRPGNVMCFEGKMAPPFNPGKPPLKYGPQFHPDKFPLPEPDQIYADVFAYTDLGLPHGKTIGYFRFKPSNSYNSTPWGRGRHPCCNSSVAWARGIPLHATSADVFAYTDLGLPHGKTIGYFRFKPDRDCYERAYPILRYEDCCNCDEPGRYNSSHYVQDECPRAPCC